MNVLGLIPARGGSKGIPRKNLVPFRGKPLLLWTCEAALTAESLCDVVLSTDDDEIAALARLAGVRVPFLRSPALARDDTPTLPVVQDALAHLKSTGSTYDAVCLLQPTNPLRAPRDIDAAVALLASRPDADSVVSVAEIPAVHHPFWAYLASADGSLRRAVPHALPARRQDLPPAWYREGALYVTRTRAIEGGSLYGEKTLPYLMPASRSGGIDTSEDLRSLESRPATAGA